MHNLLLSQGNQLVSLIPIGPQVVEGDDAFGRSRVHYVSGIVYFDLDQGVFFVEGGIDKARDEEGQTAHAVINLIK